MKASILKAMQKCCDKSILGRLGSVIYSQGRLYACDNYVLVMVGWNNDDPDMFNRDDMNLDWNAVKAAKPSEDVDVTAILVERGVPTPKFSTQFSEPTRKEKWSSEFSIDPKLLRKVTDVFAAADCKMKVEDWDDRLYLHGYTHDNGTAIDAVVMKCR